MTLFLCDACGSVKEDAVCPYCHRVTDTVHKDVPKAPSPCWQDDTLARVASFFAYGADPEAPSDASVRCPSCGARFVPED